MRDAMVQMRRLLGPTEEAEQSDQTEEQLKAFASPLDGRVTRYGFSALGSLELQDGGAWVPYAEVKEVLGEVAHLARSVEAVQMATKGVAVEAIIRRWGFNEEDGR